MQPKEVCIHWRRQLQLFAGRRNYIEQRSLLQLDLKRKTTSVYNRAYATSVERLVGIHHENKTAALLQQPMHRHAAC